LLQQAIDFSVANERQLPRDLAVAHPLTWYREPYDTPIGPFAERGPVTGIVLRHGYLVAEWGEPQRADMTFSVAKSFLSSVVGVAFDRGLIPDLNARVRDLVPIPEFQGPHNSKIAWDHMLRQTSDWEGTLWGKPDWADRPQGEPSTWLTRKRNEPGTVYKYNDVRVNALALAALHVWRKPLPQVLRDEIMDPIGATRSWRWVGYENSWIDLDGARVQSVSGGSHWGGGVSISAMDQAKIGLMLMQQGIFEGRAVLSPQWIARMQQPCDVAPFYGYLVWLNGSGQLFAAAPRSSWFAIGAGSSLTWIDAEQQLVCVLRWIDSAKANECIARIMAAI
jgi:CubicO group peptidase (beta-lactamase class C family)